MKFIKDLKILDFDMKKYDCWTTENFIEFKTKIKYILYEKHPQSY